MRRLFFTHLFTDPLRRSPTTLELARGSPFPVGRRSPICNENPLTTSHFPRSMKARSSQEPMRRRQRSLGQVDTVHPEPIPWQSSPMSTSSWIAVAFLMGLALANLALRTIRRSPILVQRRAAEARAREVQERAAEAQEKRAAEREAARRPAPGTIIVEGRVLAPPAGAEAPTVTRRNEAGCLGGPIAFRVTSFEIMRVDGIRLWVKLGPDPVVENEDRLRQSIERTSFRSGQPVPSFIPEPTGAPVVFKLQGLVRVSGVLPAVAGCLEPPETRSATLTILG